MVTTQEGKGLAEELIKLVGPLIVQQAQAGLQDIQRGQSLADTWANRSEQLTHGLKRKTARPGLDGRQTQGQTHRPKYL